MFEALANLGDFLSGIGVVVSLVYLAIQIRHNTRSVQSASYHQAAEQMWNYCFTMAASESLADIVTRDRNGEPLTPQEQLRLGSALQGLLFGFENCLRLREQGLVDDAIWNNLLDNSMPGLWVWRSHLRRRPGPLSQRLLVEIEARRSLVEPSADEAADAADAADAAKPAVA
jgi:hypothetical protein